MHINNYEVHAAALKHTMPLARVEQYIDWLLDDDASPLAHAYCVEACAGGIYHYMNHGDHGENLPHLDEEWCAGVAPAFVKLATTHMRGSAEVFFKLIHQMRNTGMALEGVAYRGDDASNATEVGARLDKDTPLDEIPTLFYIVAMERTRSLANKVSSESEAVALEVFKEVAPNATERDATTIKVLSDMASMTLRNSVTLLAQNVIGHVSEVTSAGGFQ